MYKNTKTSYRRFSAGPNHARSNRGGRSNAGPRRGSYINPDLFVSKAVAGPELAVTPITHTFNDFGLDPVITERIARRGFTTPTPIQDQSILPIMAGRDVIGIADTGTGKTAAFILPLLHKLFRDRSARALIIVPTRELAVQIEDELRAFSNGLPIFSALLIGGGGFGTQLKALQRRPQFVIGTPGRLKDHLTRGTLRLEDVSNLVLDEADRMVEMGFITDVRALISRMNHERQSLFFSATIMPEVRNLINSFMKNPETVSVKTRDTSQNVEQDVVRFTDNFHKVSLLHGMLSQEEFKKVLIFGRTKHGVEKLHESLKERGIRSVSIHGNKNQGQRQRALQEFKQDHAQVMVATDVAARGLDIPDVSHVINYDLPDNYSDYIHRIGRTGRANKKGIALTFVG